MACSPLGAVGPCAQRSPRERARPRTGSRCARWSAAAPDQRPGLTPGRQAGRCSPSRTAWTIRRHRKHQAAGASSSAGCTSAPHDAHRQMVGDSEPAWSDIWLLVSLRADPYAQPVPRHRPCTRGMPTIGACRNEPPPLRSDGGQPRRGLRQQPLRGARRPSRRRSRRWTGIEPAGRGSPVPPALKAGRPTRRLDTSTAERRGCPRSHALSAAGSGVSLLRPLHARTSEVTCAATICIPLFNPAPGLQP